MKTFLVYLLVTVAICQSMAQKISAVEITMNNEEQYDFKQIRFLEDDLKDADIILLGEPFHNRKYYPIKIQLVKYLHENFGFDLLAFESGLFSMEIVNQELKSAKDVSTAFHKGLFPVWTDTYEFDELYVYIDSLRNSGKRFDITGFDCQISSTNTSEYFVNTLKEASARNKISLKAQTLELLQRQFENLETGKKGLTEDFSKESFKALDELEEMIRPIQEMKVLHQALTGFIGHFKDLYFNKLLEKLQKGVYDFKDNNVRDSLMAVNMLFLRNELYPGRKIIGWGANLHFANDIQKLKGEHEAKNYKPMGYHLKKELKDKVFFLTISTNERIPGTIEWDLATKEIEAAYLSKKTLKRDSISSTAISNLLCGKNLLSDATDGLLYFSTKPIIAPSKNGNFTIRGRILDATTKQPIELASIVISKTGKGTLSDEHGKFSLESDSTIENQPVVLSCIGYASRHVWASRFLRSKGELTIYLTPEISMLKEVEITAKAPDAKEIFQEAINRIPLNYSTIPFNMEFYSILEMVDTTDNERYKLETVFETYYENYLSSGSRSYRITQKRETENYFASKKNYQHAQWPMVEVAFCEILSKEPNKYLYSPEYLSKINMTFLGTKLYEKDTVFVITYDFITHGELYINFRNYAILRHTTMSVGRNHRNKMELVYKKRNEKYYPAFANGDYLHVYKVDKKRKFIKIINRVQLKDITAEGVKVFSMNYDFWTSKNISYDKEYWDNNYPVK